MATRVSLKTCSSALASRTNAAHQQDALWGTTSTVRNMAVTSNEKQDQRLRMFSEFAEGMGLGMQVMLDGRRGRSFRLISVCIAWLDDRSVAREHEATRCQPHSNYPRFPSIM